MNIDPYDLPQLLTFVQQRKTSVACVRPCREIPLALRLQKTLLFASDALPMLISLAFKIKPVLFEEAILVANTNEKYQFNHIKGEAPGL